MPPELYSEKEAKASLKRASAASFAPGAPQEPGAPLMCSQARFLRNLAQGTASVQCRLCVCQVTVDQLLSPMADPACAEANLATLSKLTDEDGQPQPEDGKDNDKDDSDKVRFGSTLGARICLAAARVACQHSLAAVAAFPHATRVTRAVFSSRVSHRPASRGWRALRSAQSAPPAALLEVHTHSTLRA
jgi:hypothetical protein